MAEQESPVGAMRPEERDPKSVTTLVVGAVGVILLAVVILLLQVIYYRTSEAERWRKVISQQPEELRGAQAEQMDQINGYRWIEKQNGVVSIPIERAMRLIVEEARDRDSKGR